MSITGTWNLTLNSPLGDQAARLDLLETDGTFQGTLTGKGDPTPLADLAVKGSDVAFSADADTPVGRLNLAFTGAIAGDGISGKYSTPFGAFDFTGKRQGGAVTSEASNFEQQKAKFRTQPGFIAALDQSGGSTPKALKLYGIQESAYSGDAQMMDLIHAMRTRIMTSRAFNGDRVLAAILFENTMDREVEGRPTADYLWGVKKVVPILKVDKGLADEAAGVQLMKPMPALDALLARARAKGIFGTKMRSVIKQANPAGIKAVVDQQFEVGRQIIAAGLVPIIEPEVDIKCPDKARAEDLLKAEILAQLDELPEGQLVMLKLTIPDQDNLYAELIAHPRVLKVVALSGGYSRDEANARLSRQKGMIASFSRALTEGLTAQQSDAEFDAALDEAIGSICEASKT